MEKNRILAHPQEPAGRPGFIGRSFWLGSSLVTLAIATALAVAPNTPEAPRKPVVEQLLVEDLKVLPTDDHGYLMEEHIRPGETISSLLTRLAIRDPEAFTYFRKAPEVRIIGEQLVPGKRVSARSTANGELLNLHFPLNDRENALIVEYQDGRLVTRNSNERFERIVIARSGEIRSSLFAATDAMDIPDNVTMQMVEIFSGDIDFHRDLRKGDRFVVSFEVDYLRGQAARSGKVLGAEFTNDGKVYRAIWFEHPNGGGYYTEDGKPLKRDFLRSPLAFSRITSGFSRRFHPILNEWRAHNGVDYGAPPGTKVRATGDSTVEFIGFQKGYGNIVTLKHPGQQTTIYAHLQSFAKGLRKGSKVLQGETIGHVGSTGWATGPHLHYEFRINGRPTNPLATKQATGLPLSPDMLYRFHDETSLVKQRIEILSQIDAPPLQ